MRCELDYCIYNKDLFCILKETHVNSLGMCEGCILVSIPNNFLELFKEKQLKNIEGRWANEQEG